MASKNGNGLTVTSAAEWKNTVREGVIVPFPSGLNAKMKPVSVVGLLKAGQIPDFLTGLAQSVLFEEKSLKELATDGELLQHLEELYGIVLPLAFAEPAVAPPGQEPGEDELAFSDLDDSTKQIAFNLAISGVSAMRLFRDRQIANVQPVPDSEDNGNAAEPARRRKRRVAGAAT